MLTCIAAVVVFAGICMRAESCTFEYEIDVTDALCVGHAAHLTDEGPQLSYYVGRHRGNGIISILLTGVNRYGVFGSVVYGEADGGWFVVSSDGESERFEDESKWRERLRRMGCGSPVLRDPPSRLEALAVNAVRRLTPLDWVVAGAAVLAVIWALGPRRWHGRWM